MPDPAQFVHIDIPLHTVFDAPGPFVVAECLLAAKRRKTVSQHQDVFLLQVDEGQQLAPKVC